MPKQDKETNLNSGLPDHDGLDDTGREAILNRLAPRQVNVVGNFADLQRSGGKTAEGTSDDLKDGVEVNMVGGQDALKDSKAEEEKVAKALDKAIDAISEEKAEAEPEAMDTAKTIEAKRSEEEAKTLK